VESLHACEGLNAEEVLSAMPKEVTRRILTQLRKMNIAEFMPDINVHMCLFLNRNWQGVPGTLWFSYN